VTMVRKSKNTTAKIMINIITVVMISTLFQ
jgi:hypothetical protein